MAIIYTYPQINSSSDLAASDLMIISDMSANGRPTKSLTLKNLADFVTSTGTGTGTTNAIIKWSDGPAGLLGDSIMTENATQIDLAGTFLSTSSPTATSGPVHAIRANQSTTTGGAFNIALYGDTKHTGVTQANSNYGIYTKAEFEGTGGYTGIILGGSFEGRYDGSGTNGANASLYGSYSKANVTGASTGDIQYMIGSNVTSEMGSGTSTDVEFLQGQHTNVTFNSGNVSGDIAVNILDFDYPGGGTLQGDFAYLQIQNDPVPTPVAGTARAINSDSTLPSHFSGDVEIPLIPTANAHATSKQYVDTQIASIPAGLVFQGNWNANTNTPALASGVGTVGNYYVVSVAGNTNLDGITDWEVGDWAVFVEVGGVDKWDKIDQTFVQGAGATGQVSFWNGINSVTGDNDLYWDNVNKGLGIGTTSPNANAKLHLYNSASATDVALRITSNANSKTLIGFGDTVDQTAGAIKYDNSNSSMAFEVLNNTEAMRIISTGNVGIGTSSPNALLHLESASSPALQITDTTQPTTLRLYAQDSNTHIANITAHDMVFDTNNIERMRINSAGDIGIGTSSPGAKLEVAGDARITGDVTLSNGNALRWTSDDVRIEGTTAGDNIKFYVANTEILQLAQSGTLATITGNLRVTGAYYDSNNSPGTSGQVLSSTATGTDWVSLSEISGVDGTGTTNYVAKWSDANTITDSVIYDNGTNVGIGTTSPVVILDIHHTDTMIRLTDSDGTNQYAQFGHNNGDTTFVSRNNTSHGTYSFYTHDGTTLVERMKINSSGNVGIGTTSPVTKLHVNGIGYFEGGTSPDFGSGSVSNAGIIIQENDYIYTKDGTALRKLIGKGSADVISIGEPGTSLIDEIRLQPGNSGFTSFYDDSTETARFTDGKLGIGTTSPVAELDVVGRIELNDGNNNVSVGDLAGESFSTGDSNTALGYAAARLTTVGTDNVAIGLQALYSNVDGSASVAIGRNALYTQDPASAINVYNVAVGHNSGLSITTGDRNTLIGARTGDSLTTGQYNIAIGYQALQAEDTGNRAVAMGYQALYSQNNNTETYNTAIGFQAGYAVTTGVKNTSIGARTMQATTVGQENVALGYQALFTNVDGSKSVAIGTNSLLSQEPASATDMYNTAVGYNSGYSITTGIQNTLIGGLAGDALTDANNNIAIGYLALTTETSGGNNVAIGVTALQQSNGGTYNVAIGRDSGQQVTTGEQNTFVGAQSGDAVTTGDNNVAIGYNALGSEDVGNGSVAIGAFALEDQNSFTGGITLNTAVGYEAGKNITGGAGTGDSNTAIGGRSLDAETTGQENTAVGVEALGGQTGADKNTGLGWRAGLAISTGSNLTLLGYNAQSSTGTVSNEITLGDSNVTALRCAVTSITSLSDERDKSDIKDLTYGLELIDSLKPKEFVWDNRAEIIIEEDEDGNQIEVEHFSANKGKKDFGFIAQEVKELDDDTLRLVYDENPERLEMSYGKLVPILVKAIQELSAEVKILKNK